MSIFHWRRWRRGVGAGVNIDDLSYVIYRPASGVGPWLGVTHISGEGALQMRFDAQLGIKKHTHG